MKEKSAQWLVDELNETKAVGVTLEVDQSILVHGLCYPMIPYLFNSGDKTHYPMISLTSQELFVSKKSEEGWCFSILFLRLFKK